MPKRYIRRPSPLQLKTKHRLSDEISPAVTDSRFLASSHPPSVSLPYSVLRIRRSRRSFKLILCRMRLQWLSCLNTGLSLTLLFVTHWGEAETLAVLVVVGALSLIQTWLVMMYWSRQHQFEKMISRAIEGKSDFKPIKGHILICVIECAFHLIIPFSSGLRLGGLQLSSLANILIWCRNYHIFRMLFWTSEFSSLRAHMLAASNNVKVDGSLIFKHIAWNKSGLVASLIICEAGLLLAVCLDEEGTYSGLTTLLLLGNTPLYNPVWYEQLVLLLIVGLGFSLAGMIFVFMKRMTTFTTKEEQLSAVLARSTRAHRVRDKAAALLQAWWRLRLMRRRHRLNLDTVFTWYRTLLASTCLGTYSSSLRQYSLSSHFASIQQKMHRRIRATTVHFAIDLDRLSRQALTLKAHAVAGMRKLATLPQRLSTIMEDLSDQAQSPFLPHSIRK